MSAPDTESKTLSVEQYPASVQIYLEVDDDTDIDFPAAGSSKTIKVNTNANTWSATGNEGWIIVSEDQSKGEFEVRANYNDTYKLRSGTVTVTASNAEPLVINVSQNFSAPIFGVDVDKFDLTFNYKRSTGEYLCLVTSDIGWARKVDINADENGDKDWMAVHSLPGDTETLYMTLEENSTSAPRTATVTIYATDEELEVDPIVFKITQKNINIVDGPVLVST